LPVVTVGLPAGIVEVGWMKAAAARTAPRTIALKETILIACCEPRA
jgi:hypothetical protein